MFKIRSVGDPSNAKFKFWPRSSDAELAQVFASVIGLAQSWRNDGNVVLWQTDTVTSIHDIAATFVVDGGPDGQAIELRLVDVIDQLRGARLP